MRDKSSYVVPPTFELDIDQMSPNSANFSFFGPVWKLESAQFTQRNRREENGSVSRFL
jgi:hypothetical protein